MNNYSGRLKCIIDQARSCDPSWQILKTPGPLPLDTFNMRPGYAGNWQHPNGERGSAIWMESNFAKYLYDPSQIPEYSEQYAPGDDGNVPEAPGVYFLCSGEEIVYVGKARHINHRLRRHWEDGKQFDRFWCFGGMPESEVEQIEGFYIHLLQPRYNSKYIHLEDYLAKILIAWGVNVAAQYQ